MRWKRARERREGGRERSDGECQKGRRGAVIQLSHREAAGGREESGGK
jgi:hypothetical protein